MRTKPFSIVLALIFSGSLSAETIYLKDKTVLKGSIEGFNEDNFVVANSKGEKKIVNKKELDRIVFDDTVAQGAPDAKEISEIPIVKPRDEFSTPIKTFFYWKKSAIDGNLEQIADCFLAVAREDQLALLKNYSKEKVKEMSRETKKTEFGLAEPLYDGDKAYLSVTRKLGRNQKTEILQFQKEGENWKMVPE